MKIKGLVDAKREKRIAKWAHGLQNGRARGKKWAGGCQNKLADAKKLTMRLKVKDGRRRSALNRLVSPVA